MDYTSVTDNANLSTFV